MKKRAWIVHDEKHQILICVNDLGRMIGEMETDHPPGIVKWWIEHVGELERVYVVNRQKYIETWEEKMVKQ